MAGENRKCPPASVPLTFAIRVTKDFTPTPLEESTGLIPLIQHDVGWSVGPPVHGLVYVVVGMPLPFQRQGWAREEFLVLGEKRRAPGTPMPLEEGSRRCVVAVPGRKMAYYHGKFPDLCIDFGHGTIIDIPSFLRKDSRLKVDTQVNLVVEMRRDFLDHPFMWCRFPRIGPIPRCEFLRAMAIRLEWLDTRDRRWKTCYLGQRDIWKQVADQPGRLDMYRAAMHIYMSISRMKFSGAPSWFPKLDSDIVNFIEYDHMNQKGKLLPVMLSGTPWPKDASREYNTERIRAQCAQQGGPTFIGYRPRDMPDHRKHCDLCISLGRRGEGEVCDFKPDTGDCQKCRLLHRPCTWTSDSQMEALLKTGGKYEYLGVATDISRFAEPVDLILEAEPAMYNLVLAERVPVETPLSKAWSQGGVGWYDEDTDDWECRWVALEDLLPHAGLPPPMNS